MIEEKGMQGHKATAGATSKVILSIFFVPI